MGLEELDKLFLGKIEGDFLLSNRICVVRYYDELINLGELSLLIQNRHEEFIRVALTRRINFIETCRFLILFPHLGDTTIYRDLLRYILLSQSIYGYWIIEPAAMEADGDVFSDFILEPTIYGVSATYAGRWHRDAERSFKKAWPIFANSGGVWGHGYDATGTTLEAIRIFDRAGILKSEHANCVALRRLKEICTNVVEDKIKKYRSGRCETSWGEWSVGACIEILYRLGHNREHIIEKLENYFEAIKKLGSRAREYVRYQNRIPISLVRKMLENTIGPEDIKTLGDHILWLPIENMEISNPMAIIKTLDIKMYPSGPRNQISDDSYLALIERAHFRIAYLNFLYTVYALLRRICEVHPNLLSKALGTMKRYFSDGDI